MENTIGLSDLKNNEIQNIHNQQIDTLLTYKDPSAELLNNNPVLEILTTEYCEYFGDYLGKLGLANDPRLITLSSQHFYYYDAEELKNVQTILNLKELNRIKHLKSFLSSLAHSMPFCSNFIGCFLDNKNFNSFDVRKNSSPSFSRKYTDAIEHGIISQMPFLNRLYSLMDSRAHNTLSRMGVTMLLEGLGLKVLDMTEIYGITYFHAMKIGAAKN